MSTNCTNCAQHPRTGLDLLCDACRRPSPWMQTMSGIAFFPLDPDPADVDIHDIAHALSNICRFGGHSKEFYSVAQHSVLGSRQVLPEYAYAALLHDAAEAYIGDMVRPLKMAPEMAAYREAEPLVMSAIRAALHIPTSACCDDNLHAMDELLLASEAQALMGDPEWAQSICPGQRRVDIEPWSPREAYGSFLAQYHALCALDNIPVQYPEDES